eukprot:4014687-Amphidinium_carterae.1
MFRYLASLVAYSPVQCGGKELDDRVLHSVGDQIYGANNVSGHGPDIVDQLKNNGWMQSCASSCRESR